MILAHNTVRSDDGSAPVVIEYAETFPFKPGEREAEWHEASDEEYAAYLAYWRNKDYL